MVLHKQPFDEIALCCAHKLLLSEIRECIKMICGSHTHAHTHSLTRACAHTFWWVHLYICRPVGSVMTCVVQS